MIPLLEDSKGIKLQYLTVPVDIPQMGVVHTACFRLHSSREAISTDSTEMEYVAIAQPIAAELIIKHTRRWLTQTELRRKNQPLEFCYEVHANPDTWLIGGQRKAHFSAKVCDLTNRISEYADDSLGE